MKATAPVKNHPNYSDADYSYLAGKGYTNTEILAIWNRDRAAGHTEPQLHLRKAPDVIGRLSAFIASRAS